MKFNLNDIVGIVIGRLTILRHAGVKDGAHFYLCLCKCGKEISASRSNLRNLNTQSCGCLKREARHNYTHGKSNTFEHRVWKGLHTRCNNPNHHSFKNYGERGIKICEAWKEFETFLKDMGLAPPNTSLDRIDNNGDYSAANCRWAKKSAQMQNHRRNRNFEIDGQTKCLAAWARQYGVNQNSLRIKIDRGSSIQEALATLPKALA